MSAARSRTVPAFAYVASAPGSCTTASMCPPIRLGTTCAAAYGTSVTSTPAALNSATDEMWVWLPTPELPTVILPGCAFASARKSASVFHGDSVRTASTGDSTSTRATGSNAL